MTAPPQIIVPITRAELKVLRALMLDGADNATVAGRVGVSIDTVKTHMKRIYRKTGCETRTELVVSIGRGWIRLVLLTSILDAGTEIDLSWA